MPSPGIEVELSPARLEWNENQPVSSEFGDIYHSKDGISEVHRFFIEPCNIAQRISGLQGREFVIAELGFGTGLNCAVLCDLFLHLSSPGDRLHFVSFEKHPLSHADFFAISQRRSVELPVYSDLAKAYPPLLGGWHRRTIMHGKITLSIFFGAADLGLSGLLQHGTLHYVNHWLLDGFAPALNPQMWDKELLHNLGNLTAPQGTVATFTAVGQVRRDLTSAGFKMRRIAQQPFKRHSLAGEHAGSKHVEPPKPEVLVVGGGIAGACVANSMAKQNIKVRLLEPYIDTQRAGDISPALLHARLLADDSLGALVRSRSYLHASAWLSSNSLFNSTGVLQTLGSNTNIEKLQRLYARYQHSGNWIQLLDASRASIMAGSQLENPALYFPGSGSVDLGLLRRSLYTHKNILAIRETVTGIRQISGGWHVSGISTSYETGDLVLCPGDHVSHFDLLTYLEMTNTYGQLNTLSQSLEINLPIIGEGFVCPNGSGNSATIGATYEHSIWPQAKASAFNLDRFRTWWPHISKQPLQTGKSDLTNVSRSMRSSGRDRIPVIGAVFDADLQALPHLWLSCGHGSSGLTTAPLAADIITSQILKTPPPTDLRLAEHCSSVRFRIRQRRRGQL